MTAVTAIQIETAPLGQVHTAAAGAVIDACTDPYGRMIATANTDGTIRLYSAAMGDTGVASEALSCLTHHRAAVCRIVWMPPAYGNVMVSAGHDGLLALWQEMGGIWRVAAKQEFPQPLADIAVVDDKVFIACLDGNLHYCRLTFQVNPAIECVSSTVCRFIPLTIDARIVGESIQVACGLLSGYLAIFLVSNQHIFTEEENIRLLETPSPIRSVAWGNALLNPYASLAIGYETGELLVYRANAGDRVDFSALVYSKVLERPLCRVKYGPTGAVLAVAYGDGKSELLSPFVNIQ